MYDKSQSTSLFTAAQGGLQTSMQYLFSQSKDGSITRTALNNAIYGNANGVNSSFFQMINSDFATLDKNNDGKLSADEANKMISNLSSGLTRNQILQMRAQGAIDDELASKILANFSKVDTNGDGMVSEGEINAYCMDEDIQDKRDEQTKLTIKNMSLYYDTDTDDVSESENS